VTVTFVKNPFSKIKFYAKNFIQRVFITIELYTENGLANHSAACAYGFFLSIAPILLLIAFILSFTFKASTKVITDLLANIPILENLFNEEWLANDFFTLSMPGISGIISAVSIIWAGRILSLSIQRGFKVIFPGEKSRNPIMDTLVTLAIEAVVLIIILTAIFSSRAALWFYKMFDFLPQKTFLLFITSPAGMRFSSIFVFSFFSFLAYLLIPVNHPRKFSAFQGVCIFAAAYSCVSFFLDFILDISKYNFLYGALGGLVVLLVTVYFFFNFFLLGAQFAFVTDFFDVLFFSKIRQITAIQAKETEEKKSTTELIFSRLLYNLYFPHNEKMTKNLRRYEKDSIIFSQGDSVDDIYYLLKGEVEVSSSQKDTSAEIIKADSFFNEMGHLLSEKKNATIMAKTDVSVYVLPPHLFNAVLKYDINLDRDIIEHISRRVKDSKNPAKP